MLARFFAHQFTDTGPMRKFRRLQDIDHRNSSARFLGAATGKIKRLMQLICIIDNNEEKTFTCILSHEGLLHAVSN